MLLHAYLDRVGAEAIFATLAGGPARRYDDLAVLCTATLGFALGIDTIEGAKHLRRGEAGAAIGLGAVPELKTLRTRLGALADGTDPLALQRAFAARMLAADPAGEAVYFVDDHFVPYAGARPVGKGWNTKRRHAGPGRDDTLLVDARGRAVVFGSGEPTGLSTTLPGILAQLRQVIGPHAPVLLGFDRGGAYPVVFTACRDAGAHWVTYRRAPLVQVTATPRRSWTVRDGKRITVVLADESVQITGYGQARQLTLFEHDQPVLQVLTSDTHATGADLLCWLRSRWRIENMFKYASEHNGIDALADYRMDTAPDPRMLPNPARVAARARVTAAKAELAAAERALPQLLNGAGTPAHKNAQLPSAHRRIEQATAALADAKAVLKPIPAKIAATELDPDAKRAYPRLARRGLQMVLRLLAFNAEAWLAEHLNAYLADPDEYRARARSRCLLGCSEGGVRAGCAPTGCQSRSSLVGVPLVHVLLFTRLVSLVADDPGVTANTTGLPGLVQLRSIVGGMLTFGLVACVAALVASAVTWGFGANSGNPHLAGRGKTGVVVSAGAALLIGAANAIVAFFSAAGGTL